MLCFIHLAQFFRRDGKAVFRAEDGPNQPVIGTVQIGLVESRRHTSGDRRAGLERAPWSGAKGNVRILDVREQAAVLCLVYGRRNNSKILAKDTAEM